MYLSKMENTILKEVTVLAYKESEELLLKSPAARKHHHNYVHGLAYHTMDMMNTAFAMSVIKPYLNLDLLIAGVLFHDLEKTREFELNEIGLCSQYSVDGALLGHISMGIEKIERICARFDIEKPLEDGTKWGDTKEILYLKHMILSHHGKQEWGSPVTPMTPEAEALHYIDNMDAHIQIKHDYAIKVSVGEINRDLPDRSFAANSPLAVEVSEEVYATSFFDRMASALAKYKQE